MKIIKLAAVITASLIAFSANAATEAASSLKLGVVDLPVILQQAPQVAVISQKLKEEFAPKQKQISELQSKLRQEVGQLTSPNASKMKDEDKKKIQELVASDQKELQTQVLQLQEAVAHAQAKAMQKFFGEIDGVAANIAKKEGLDMIVLKQAVLYPQGKDITKEVIDQLPKN